MKQECEKCAQFDLETQSKTRELFHQDGMAFMIVLLANSIQGRTEANKKLSNNGTQSAMIQKMHNQRHIDFASALMGTFLIGMDDINRQKTLNTLSALGMSLDIKHEKCTHG